MIESLYIAETGLNSQQKLIEVISNNIANNSTPAYKRNDVNFVDLVYGNDKHQLDLEGNAEIDTNGGGVRVESEYTDFRMGSLKQTNNPFDIAINGSGFIEVEHADGQVAYTRAGRLRLDDEGNLTNSQGLVLTSNVQIPPDVKALTIDSEGNVLIRAGDDPQAINVGQIELVTFGNTNGLARLGDNLYQATKDSGDAIYQGLDRNSTGQILQGYTEMSNVTLNEEMVNLMLAQRGYQLNARIIQVADQVMETINNLRR